LRDWVFSRQRYWGEPIPIVYDEHGHAYPLHESELPLYLPETVDFQPPIGAVDPIPPLGRCTEWIKIQGEIRDGKVMTQNLTNPQTFYREASTMPNWAGSSWYYLRYLDPHNDKELIGKNTLNHYCKDKYAAVDLYIIGAEHTVLHLLYARFWHLFLFDRGYIPNPEPWKRMLHQGMITANAYTDENGSYIDVSDVEYDGKVAHQKSTGKILNVIQGKMGKSYKNGIPPEEICAQYSTDVFRLHMMYMAPVTQTRDWNSETIVGMERFCQSVSRMVQKSIELNLPESDQKVQIKLHQVIKVVTEHYNSFHINTAISSMIELCNMVEDNLSLQDCIIFLTLLAPCAPHLCEYWYQEIKKLYPAYCQTTSILQSNWPNFDVHILSMSLINVPVKINNKLKFVLEVSQDISEENIKELINEKIDSIHDYTIIIAAKDSRIRAINLIQKI
jgi:leucyl-tRNA synthetase